MLSSVFCESESFLFVSPVLVAHASLFIQNISVTVCSIVLMLVFLYKQRIEEIWDGWLTVSRRCLFLLITTFHDMNYLHDHCTEELLLPLSPLCPVSLLSLLLSSWLLCAVIVTCCIAKLTQGGLLYGGDRPGRCGKPCKHSTNHCHSEGLDCGYHRLQPGPPRW